MNGLGIGIEYIGKDLDEDIDESVVILEILCFRMILWLGDFDEE